MFLAYSTNSKNSKYIESIKLLEKVVILTGLDGDLSLYEMSYNLPLCENPQYFTYVINIIWYLRQPISQTNPTTTEIKLKAPQQI